MSSLAMSKTIRLDEREIIKLMKIIGRVLEQIKILKVENIHS